jgi:hypothetical protein
MCCHMEALARERAVTLLSRESLCQNLHRWSQLEGPSSGEPTIAVAIPQIRGNRRPPNDHVLRIIKGRMTGFVVYSEKNHMEAPKTPSKR